MDKDAFIKKHDRLSIQAYREVYWQLILEQAEFRKRFAAYNQERKEKGETEFQFQGKRLLPESAIALAELFIKKFPDLMRDLDTKTDFEVDKEKEELLGLQKKIKDVISGKKET